MNSMYEGRRFRLRAITENVLRAGLILFAAASAARAQDQTVQLLELLTNAPGPPGFEEPVRKIMVERMTPLADKLIYDGLGSVIATQGSSGPRVMIDAHMDELGAVARRVTADGFVGVAPDHQELTVGGSV